MNTCALCSMPALAATLMDSDAVSKAVGQLLDSIESSCASIITNPPSSPVVGTLMTERCAQLAEQRCNACHQAECVSCEIASDIRTASERLYQEREKECAAWQIEHGVDSVVQLTASALCPKHGEFGRILLETHYKRRAWSSATAT